VVAIADGEVVYAANNGSWGNVVVVKHTLNDGTVLFSNYAHLKSISAQKGAIAQGASIGEVGATGNAYGNHLHFQIDTTNIFHPYYYNACAKGKDTMALVNNGECRSDMIANTIDPIAFLEKVASAPKVVPSKTTVNQTIKQTQEAPKIDTSHMKTREQIIADEISEFIGKFNINLDFGVMGPNKALGQTTHAIFSVTYKRDGKAYEGNFPGSGIEIVFDKKALRIFPEKIILLEKGLRTFDIVGLKAGAHTVDFKLGANTLFTTTFFVYTNKDVANPTSARIVQPVNTRIGELKRGAVILKTSYGSDQIAIPYDSAYVLSSTSGKVKFCNLSANANRKCKNSELTEALEFRYADTKQGVLIYSLVAMDYMPVRLALKKVDIGKVITKGSADITVLNPMTLDKTEPYFTSIIASLKKGVFFLKDGYALQKRTVQLKQAREMVINYLGYRYLKAGSNATKKASIIRHASALEVLWKNSGQNEFLEISRGACVRLLFESLNIPTASSTSSKFIDEGTVYKNEIFTLTQKMDFSWQDDFGKRYFQPDKLITGGEVTYLFDKIDAYIVATGLY